MGKPPAAAEGFPKIRMKLWGGRFKKQIDETFARFNASFSFDVRLLREDIEGSIAYAEALYRANVLSESEAGAIKEGLETIWQKANEEPDYLRAQSEDVHSFVEEKLVELIGDVAFKLHTGRSRNEQVAVDMRLFLLREIHEVQAQLYNLQRSILSLAKENFAVVVPGYTHLQKAQPVLFAHYLLAFYEMFKRDSMRLDECSNRTDESPLGCGAIAGTSYPLDRQKLAEDLGLGRIARNSLDAVSDRDFVAEFIFAAALIMAHLSRLAEDFIMYATSEFRFIKLSDTVSTGSSLMPQKKNPDALELIRGKCARVIGNLTTILTLLKGLPMSYNKDLQEDKEPLFDTVDTVKEAVGIMALVLDNIELDTERLQEVVKSDYLLATDLADYLVKKGMPFRKAHEIVGKIVLYAFDNKKQLEDLTLEEFQAVSERFDKDVYESIALDASLSKKQQVGGTAPARVAEALRQAEEELADVRKRLNLVERVKP